MQGTSGRSDTPPPKTAGTMSRASRAAGDGPKEGGSNLSTPPRSAPGSRGGSGPAFFNQRQQMSVPSSGKRTASQAPPGTRSGYPLPPRSALSATGVEAHNMREQDNIKVVVRVRPMNERETTAGETMAVQLSETDTTTLQITSSATRGATLSRQFGFHGVLPPSCRQSDVLQACGITQLLDAALAGFHVTIFAYGQTGSGKTFTMSGREDVLALENYAGDSDDGIVTRSVMYLFEQIQKRPKGAAPIAIRASYCEIYNEALYDLLRWSKQQLSVRWDAQRGFHAPDLALKDCATVDDLLQVISRGMRNRRIGSHELNLESSRSHSIVTVHCTTSAGDDNDSCTRFGKVSFVDLAGSERVKDTHTTGEMLKETSSINRSLFTLGKVISALAEREAGGAGAVPHIPYRDSKLTKLLMDSLGGSALALMVACVSPAHGAAEETLSTLSYAARAKNIRNQPVVQLDAKDAAIAALKREVALLRAENQYLRDQLEAADTAGQSLPPVALPEGGAEQLPAAVPALMTPRMRLAASQAGTQGVEPLMARIAEAEALLVRYSKENERLASVNNRLQFRREFVDTDYTGALEEVDWLRMKLERIEGALKDQVGKGGTLARIMSRQMDRGLLPTSIPKDDTPAEQASGDDLTRELGALLNKIAADAKAGPPPSFASSTLGLEATSVLPDAARAPSPGHSPIEAAQAVLSAEASAKGKENEAVVPVPAPGPTGIEGGTLTAVGPLEGIPGALVASSLLMQPEDPSTPPRPVSRRGRGSKDGVLDPQAPLTSPPGPWLGPADSAVAPPAGAAQPSIPIPSAASLAAAGGSKKQPPNVSKAAADAEVTIYVKGPAPARGGVAQQDSKAAAPKEQPAAAGDGPGTTIPSGHQATSKVASPEKPTPHEKPWRKAKGQRNNAPGAEKDAGGQIHADPAKLALLLE